MFLRLNPKFLAGVTLFCALVTSVLPFLAAQEVRYQLGKQVIAFESDFERGHQDLAIRKKVIPSLQSAVQSFFQLSLSDAEKFVDAARIELISPEEQDFAKALISVRLAPKSRWFDSSKVEIDWTLKESYNADESVAMPVQLQLTWRDSSGDDSKPSFATEHNIESFPLDFRQTVQAGKVAEQDVRVEAKLVGNQKEITMPWQMISFSDDRDQRLLAATEQMKAIPKEPRSNLRQSLELNLKLLRDLARGRVQETDYPAHAILVQSERWLKQAQANEPAIDLSRAGQYWLDFSKVGKSGVVRIQVPRDSDASKPFKVLVAYHGAGGSENMFFDSYGAGRLATLAREAGYVLVAPRQPLLSGMLPLQELLDSLAESLPIDRKRVDLIGHSMGAGQLIQQVEQNPGVARSCASLGGGRGITKPVAWAKMPVFAAAGDVDFGKRGVLAFSESVSQAGAVVDERIYENVEHLAIVQVSLADIFDWFQKVD